MKISEMLLEKSGKRTILFTDEINCRYACGFAYSDGASIVSAERTYLITDGRYIEAAEKAELNAEVDPVCIKESVYEEVKALAGQEELAFDPKYMSYSDYTSFTENYGLKLIPVKGLAAHARMIKQSAEIEKIRRAQKITDRAFTLFIELLRPRMTEREAAARLEYIMKQEGAEGYAFDTILISGTGTSVPHGVPTDKAIMDGDLVTMDFGAKYCGYCSDMTRTVVLGEPDDRTKKVYYTVLEAQKKALAAIKADIAGTIPDKEARDVIERAGFGEYFTHSTGHSLGLEIHENPRFSPKYEKPVPAGAVMTVEPGIYIPGELGVRIEDMVLVTEKGYENLTESPKELLVIKS